MEEENNQKLNWSLTQIWNEQLTFGRKERVLEKRTHIWASELGKSHYDRYLKMNAIKPDFDYDERTLRKFEAGNFFERIVGFVLISSGLLIYDNKWYQIPEDEDHLAISVKPDFIAGGKPDWEKARKEVDEQVLFMLMPALGRIAKQIVKVFSEKYPDGLKKLPFEIKSVNCLPAGQLVYANNKRVPIENVKKGMKVVSLKKGFGLTNGIVKNVWKSGRKKIYRITTKTGRKLECSEGHKFLTSTVKWQDDKNIDDNNIKWKELNELKIGQKIAVPKVYPRIFVFNNPNSNEKALILGWLIGDGTIDKHYQSTLVTETEEEANFIKKIADKEFDLDCSVNKYLSRPSVYTIGLNGGVKNRKGRSNRSNKMILWLEKMNFSPKGVNKYVPDWIFDSSEKTIGKFLSGLFQADGCVRKNGSNSIEVMFYTISERLAYDVQHLLLKIGILSHLKKCNHSKSGYPSKHKFIYKIGIRNIDLIEFNKKIGFYFHKKEKLNNLLKNWKPRDVKRKKNIFFDIIKSIEYIGKKNTYDLEVDVESHSYCVNDILTHNSMVFWAKKDYLQEAYPHHSLQTLAEMKATGLDEGRLFYISKDDLTTAEFPLFINDEKLNKLYEDDVRQITKYIREEIEPPKPENVVFDPKKNLRFQYLKEKRVINGCYVENWQIGWSNYISRITNIKGKTQKEVFEIWKDKIKPEIKEKNDKLKEEFKIKIDGGKHKKEVKKMEKETAERDPWED